MRHKVHDQQLHDEEGACKAHNIILPHRGDDPELASLALTLAIEFVAVAARPCALKCTVHREVTVKGKEDAAEQE